MKTSTMKFYAAATALLIGIVCSGSASAVPIAAPKNIENARPTPWSPMMRVGYYGYSRGYHGYYGHRHYYGRYHYSRPYYRDYRRGYYGRYYRPRSYYGYYARPHYGYNYRRW